MTAPRSDDRRVAVAIVHYRSGGMLLDLLSDLEAQEGVELDIHVVESGDDGSVARARGRHPGLQVHDVGRNLGYAGGNNLAFTRIVGSAPVLIVNPDVRMEDRTTVRSLLEVLESEPDTAAIAPVIRDAEGRIEYVSSHVDPRRAVAIHTDTHVTRWPSDSPTRSLSWLDGACLLVRRAAWESIGGFDERYFLIVEEVDWCLRARAAGWGLLLHRDSEVAHQRSSSFAESTKSAYYSARNTYLLFSEHGHGWAWRLHWAVRSARVAASRRSRRAGASRPVLRGMVDAVRARTGPAPEDT